MPLSSESGRGAVIRLLLLVAVAGILLVGEFLEHFFLGRAPTSRAWNPVSVVIPSGVAVSDIGRRLCAAGIVESPQIFKLAAHYFDVTHKLQAGELDLSPGLPMEQLLHRLTEVQAAGVRVVVREGLSAAQLAELLESSVGIDHEEFLRVVYDTAFAESLGFPGVSLEGYLFPDTYFFSRGASPRRAATRMALNFLRKAPDSIFAGSERYNLDRHQIVTLASILQWEVLWPSEWEIVSAVYHNRLRRHMLLQADPTVNYVLGQGPSRFSLRDLSVESPYNTYRHKGLPPGPINSPGLRAIRAALNPAKVNYLFFVAQEDGSHAFSRTAQEHLRAKAEAERVRQQAKKDTTESG
jgi:UPF0755 protein